VAEPARQHFHLLAGLDDRARERVASVATPERIPAGEVVVREGDFGWVMYLIEEGEGEVRHHGELVATLGPGDFFGEIGVLVTGRRTASVVARTPLRLLMIFERQLLELENEMPVLAETLRAALAERLAKTR
jgi:CRP-like cAMP-binding protein